MPTTNLKRRNRSDKTSLEYNDATQERARWCMETKKQHGPGLMYSALLRMVCKHFQCGKTAGEKAIACYYAMLHEWATDPKRGDEIMGAFLELHDKARAAGQYGAASSALAEARDMMGIGPVKKTEMTINGQMTIQANHTHALKLTPAQRKQRIIELKQKELADGTEE